MPSFADALTPGEQNWLIGGAILLIPVLIGAWEKVRTLWAKQRADSIAELERTVLRQESKIEKLEAENDECQRRAVVQDGKIGHLEEVVAELKRQNAEQAGQIADLRRVLSAVERDGRYAVRPSGGYVVPNAGEVKP